MSRLVQRQWTYFQLLISETSEIQKQRLLETIMGDQLRALIQIVLNFFAKNFYRFTISYNAIRTTQTPA